MAHYLVELLVIGGGLIVLIGLALLIGHVDASARDQAWRRIADARRLQREHEQVLLDHLTTCPCERCPLRRDLPTRFGD